MKRVRRLKLYPGSWVSVKEPSSSSKIAVIYKKVAGICEQKFFSIKTQTKKQRTRFKSSRNIKHPTVSNCVNQINGTNPTSLWQRSGLIVSGIREQSDIR